MWVTFKLVIQCDKIYDILSRVRSPSLDTSPVNDRRVRGAYAIDARSFGAHFLGIDLV